MGNPFVVAGKGSVVVAGNQFVEIVAGNQFVEVVAETQFVAVEGENQVAAAVIAKTTRRAGVQLAAVEVRPKGC